MECKFFFSPQPIAQKKNEFIDHFFDTLARKANVVNYGKKALSRSADYFRYFFSADAMILNWPEDILHLKFGIVQLFSSFFILSLFKLKGGTIIWVCHNKESHKKQYKWLRKISRSFFKKISDIIIVLSKDALDHFSAIKQKVFFLNHPVYLSPELSNGASDKASTNVLIWGNINPYKGLDEFIESYRMHKCSFSVKIIGSADKIYFENIKEKTKGLPIEVIDKFLSKEELIHQFADTNIILLPYKDSDTFSSGALIHSLCSGKIIIGPAIGNFLDLSNMGACLVYDNFANLFNLINSLLTNEHFYHEQLSEARKSIRKYYNLNTWDNFIDELLQIIYKHGKEIAINETLNVKPID